MSEVPRAGRLATLRQLLAEARYTSQAELIVELAAQGITVSQGTLSRDLDELGAVRQRSAEGILVYAAAQEEPGKVALAKLASLSPELLISLRQANNQIVIKTPAGAAQYFASYLDSAALPTVLGTIAGDDTVLVIVVDEASAKSLADEIAEMTKTGKPSKES